MLRVTILLLLLCCALTKRSYAHDVVGDVGASWDVEARMHPTAPHGRQIQVVSNEIALALDKSTYFLGEYINVAYSSSNLIPFQYYDSICIIHENVTEYKINECEKISYLFSSITQLTQTLSCTPFLPAKELSQTCSSIFDAQ